MCKVNKLCYDNEDESKYVSYQNWWAVHTENNIYIAEFSSNGELQKFRYYDLLADPFR